MQAPSHAARLEAAERQLAVFAREINQLYRAERLRRAELARALEELRAGAGFDPAAVAAFLSELEAIFALRAGQRRGEEARAGSFAGR